MSNQGKFKKERYFFIQLSGEYRLEECQIELSSDVTAKRGEGGFSRVSGKCVNVHASMRVGGSRQPVHTKGGVSSYYINRMTRQQSRNLRAI